MSMEEYISKCYEFMFNVNTKIKESVYVAGLLFWGSTTAIVNSPLNHSVVFIREAELVLTSDHWRVIVNFDLSAYEEAITVLREDLTRVEEIANHSTPIGELRQVDLALNSFEDNLLNLKRYLPKANRKRGWECRRVNIEGDLRDRDYARSR